MNKKTLIFIIVFLIIRTGSIFAADSAVIVLETVPFCLVADTSFTLPITIKNTGSTTWDTAGGYKLGSQSPQDNSVWGINRVNLEDTDSIAPNDTKIFYVSITTPAAAADTYEFQWQMIKEGTGFFGDSSTHRIIPVYVIGSPVTAINTLDYFISDHLDSALTGPHQSSQTVNGQKTYYVKWNSSAIETFIWDREYLYEKEDHTMSNDPPYLLEPGVWMKLIMNTGESIDMSSNRLYWYSQPYKCTLTGVYAPKSHPYTTTLEAHIPNVDVGGDLGSQEVIILKYDYGYNYEKFYYSKEWGWIAWEWYSPQNLMHQQSAFTSISGPATTPDSDYTAQTVDIVDTSDSKIITVNSYFGNHTIGIESNTFSESVTVIAYIPPTPFLTSYPMPGNNVRFTDLGLKITVDTDVTSIKNVFVTLFYRDQDITGYDENKFILGYYSDTINGWVALNSVLDTSGNCISAEAPAPSTYQILEWHNTNSDSTWYVSNDTGYDTYTGSSTEPFKTISKALSVVSYGETVFIYAGFYSETIIVNRDNITITGADSVSTILNINDSSSNSGYNGIYAQDISGLKINNLQIRDSYRGISWNNVDNSNIENVTVLNCGNRGIYLYGSSDTNILSNNHVFACSDNGFFIESSYSDTITGNISDSNTGSGFVLLSSVNNVLLNNVSSTNSFIGFYLGSSSNNNVLDTNSTFNNISVGFFVENSNINTLSGNYSYNDLKGFELNASNNNILYNNTCIASKDNGFIVQNGSISNYLENNLSSLNTWSGFGIISSSNNGFTNNTSSSNNANGFYILSSSSNNTFSNNLSYNNSNYGIRIDDSIDNYFSQNRIDSNSSYAVYLHGNVSSDTFSKNIIIPCPSDTSLGVLNDNSSSFYFTLNWWGNTDSSSISSKISNTGGGTIIYIPFRLGIIDTGAGHDTLSPNFPAGVAWDSEIAKLHWDEVSLNEDGSALTDLSGYRIYRTTSLSENNWKLNAFVTYITDTEYYDTSIRSGETYYFCVTACDSNSIENESWFSSRTDAVIYNDISGTAVFSNIRYTSDSNIFIILKNISGDTLETGYADTDGYYKIHGFYNSETVYISFTFPGYISIESTIAGNADTVLGIKYLIGGDMDSDNDIDTADFSILQSFINKPSSIFPFADLDGNHYINTTDISILIKNFSK